MDQPGEEKPKKVRSKMLLDSEQSDRKSLEQMHRLAEVIANGGKATIKINSEEGRRHTIRQIDYFLQVIDSVRENEKDAEKRRKNKIVKEEFERLRKELEG